MNPPDAHAYPTGHGDGLTRAEALGNAPAARRDLLASGPNADTPETIRRGGRTGRPLAWRKPGPLPADGEGDDAERLL